MKMKRILSCLMAAAMVGGLAVMPVSAENKFYTRTRYEGEDWVLAKYPDAEKHQPGNDVYRNALSGTYDGGWISTNYQNKTPETVELSFKVDANDYYKISGVTTHARGDYANFPYSTYEVYIDDKNIECDFVGFSGPFDKVISKKGIYLDEGEHKIEFKLNVLPDGTTRKFGIDYIDFFPAKVYEGEDWVLAKYNDKSGNLAEIYTPTDANNQKELSEGKLGGWISAKYQNNTPTTVELSFDVYAHAYYDISGITTNTRDGNYSKYKMYIDDQEVTYKGEGLVSVYDTIKSNDSVLLTKGEHKIRFELDPVSSDGVRKFGIDYLMFDQVEEYTEPTAEPKPVTMETYGEKEYNEDEETFNVGYTASEALDASGCDYFMFKFDNGDTYGYDLGTQITGEGDIVLGVLLKNVNKKYENSDISFALANKTEVGIK